MQFRIMLLIIAVGWSPSLADEKEFAPKAIDAPPFKYTLLRKYRLRLHYRVTAPNTPIQRVVATGAVPIEWPEQKVRLIEEKKSRSLRIRESRIKGQGGFMTFQAAGIRAGGYVEVDRLYELARYKVSFVGDPNTLKIAKKTPRTLRDFLRPAPGVETTSKRIKSLASDFKIEANDAWQSVRTVQQWIPSNIRYQQGLYRGAVATLQQETGDCEDMTALFVAICRIKGIPARTVWIEGHAYPEFYLEDDEGGHWIPTQLAGADSFGEIAEDRLILQKGDRFYDPLRKKYGHYLPHSVQAVGGAPKLHMTREMLPAESK
ncbi:MAG: hypothetical protein CMJ78_06615 [Planctomycetaceae bacterium]|nr:hypothetical protein [Planctomycetaceae bacterium]